MIQAPEGSKVVSFEGLVHRADGTVENLGLIDHSHPWLLTEQEITDWAHSAAHAALLLERKALGLPGAVIIPTGSASIAGGKAVFAGQVGGQTTTPPQYIAFGQGDPAGTRVTALVTDLGLAGEIAAPGGTNTNTGQSARITGTVTQQTTTNLNDTTQVVGTLTAGTSLAIVEAALFTSSAFPGQTTVATLSALSGTGTGTATLTSSTGLPTASTNYQIDQEVITGTLSGTTLSISARGVNGTTAAAHSGTPTITVCSPTGTGGGGYMAVKGDFAVINLATSDTLQLTAKIQFS